MGKKEEISSSCMRHFDVIWQELLVAALEFRNKHASQPYLPEELIPAELRQVRATSVSSVSHLYCAEICQHLH